MHRPRLSIAVPCYNAGATVDVTIRSLVQQDLRDVEIILIDDASSDGSAALLDEWARRDSRIRLIRLEANRGIGEVRNLALRECSGDYIAFVDADDWVTRSYHQNLVSAADDLGVDFVKSDHVRVTGTERTIVFAPAVARSRSLPPLHAIERLDIATMVDYAFVWCGVFRRDFVARAELDFGTELHTAEDRIFTWKAHLRGGSYACISECGYLYRREGESSLTRIGDLRQLGFLRCVDQTLQLLADHGASEALARKAYRQALALIVFHFDRRERFSPEVWYEYCARTRALLEGMDLARLRAVYDDFGSRRIEVIEGLRTGSTSILEP